MKTDLVAVTPRGTFTRKTDHGYTFVVAHTGQRSESFIQKHFAEKLAYNKSRVGLCEPKYKADYQKEIDNHEANLALELENNAKRTTWDCSWHHDRKNAERAAKKLAAYGYVSVEIYEVSGPMPVKTQSNPQSTKEEETMTTKTEKKTPAKADKKPSKKLDINPSGKCLCGCGTAVPKGSRFVPGHDGKLHSAVLKAYKAGKVLRVSKATFEYLRNAHYVTSAISKFIASR